MPFFLIPTALGVCFFLIWAFIGGMVFRDSQLAEQQERESGVTIAPLGFRRVDGAHRLSRVPRTRVRANKCAAKLVT